LVRADVARVFVGVIVGKARGKDGSGLGEEKLGVGWEFMRAWWAPVFEALENVEPVEDVVVKVGWRGNRVVFVTCGVRIVGCV
jgi:hypothetical protein